MTTLSKSKVLMYENCSWSYKLQFVDFKDVPQDKLPEALVKGNEVHKMLDDFYKPDSTNINLLIGSIALHPNYEKYRTDINNFINFNKYLITKKELFVPIYREEKIYCDELGISGIVDRIGIGKDGLVLVDYKTGKSKNINEFRFELALYTYLFEKNFNQKINQWGIYFVSEDKYIIEPRNQEEINKAIERVHKTRKLIKEAKFEKNPIYSCKWCKFYKVHCEGV